MTTQTIDQLLLENDELRHRLEDAEEAIRALSAGEVDAVFVGAEREQVYTLETADKPYRLLVERMSQGAATLTAAGMIIYCNRRFADLLGQPLHDLLGKPIRDLMTAESRPRFDAMLRDGLNADVQDEFVLQEADGTPVPVYLGVSALREGALGPCLIVTDLTDQRHYQQLQRTQEALRASEARLRVILDNTPAVVYLVDDQQRFTFINRRWKDLFSVTNEQVAGRSIYEFFPREIADKLVANNRKVLAGRCPLEFEETVPLADGKHTYISSKVPLFDSAGNSYGICGISIDITERKRAEAAMKEADRSKDRFLATLSHELRNPLAPIRNAIQILKAKGLPDPELQWAHDVIDRQVQQMSRLLEELLDVSRIARNKVELRKECVELAAVVEMALETSNPAIDDGGHKLTVSLPTEPIYLEADPARLAQVFSNLLNNAAKYTDDGGSIALTAERHGSNVIVSVHDNGIGIAAEMLPRIFAIFSQAEPAAERSQGGLGIGLSLVKGLVELHGGSIEVRSDGLGRGSEFVVRLPVAPANLVPEPPQRTEDSKQRPVTKCRVLVVDDNRDSADSLSMLLRIMGNEVSTAYDGEQAIEVAATRRPDVVLLDVGMPKLNGYEACRRIRQQPWGEAMYLIAVTGWGRDEDRRNTEEAGFNHHMVKPVDPAGLMKLLASLPCE